MSVLDASKAYDAYYYAHGCGEQPYERNEHWLSFFASIADQIVTQVQPHSILDAGCAMGFLVEALRSRGVDAFGVDVSEYAIQQVHQDVRPYCWVGQVTEALPRRYDLIVCIETLEHMTAAEATSAIANFCQHTNDILFSSSPFDYKEATHLNVQPPEYWAELFARHGFFRDVDFDASFITPWAVRFRQRDDPLHRILRDYERQFWRLWKENQDTRQLTIEMRDQLAAQEQLTQALRASVTEKEQTLDTITGSTGWKILTRLRRVKRRFFPPPGR